MANITKANAPYLVDRRIEPKAGSWPAAEIIPVGSPVYVHTDGKVYKSITTTTSPTLVTLAAYDGFSILGAAAVGDPVTIEGPGTRVHITETTGIIIGNGYWVSATAAAISDAIVLAGDRPFAVGVSATDIEICRNPG